MLAESGLVLAAVALGRWWQVPAFGRLEWELGAVAAGIGATAPLLVGLWWCLGTRWPPVRRLIEVVEEQVAPLFAGATSAQVALVALLAGVGEEAFFRGVLQESLSRVLPAAAALAIAGGLFGAAHWVTATYAALAPVVGLYLGTLFILSGNLLAPIVTHALYDLVAMMVLVRMKPVSPPSVV